jgi:hypothetical protein
MIHVSFAMLFYRNSKPIPTPSPLAQPSPLRPTRGRAMFSSILMGSNLYKNPKPALRFGDEYKLLTLSTNVRSAITIIVSTEVPHRPAQTYGCSMR